MTTEKEKCQYCGQPAEWGKFECRCTGLEDVIERILDKQLSSYGKRAKYPKAVNKRTTP